DGLRVEPGRIVALNGRLPIRPEAWDARDHLSHLPPPAALIDVAARGVGMTDRPAILITGATDGLGRALASRLAADGATLILHGRDRRRLNGAADEIGGAGGAGRPRTRPAPLAHPPPGPRPPPGLRAATDRRPPRRGHRRRRARRARSPYQRRRVRAAIRRELSRWVPAHPGAAPAAAGVGADPHRQRRLPRPAPA